MARSKASLKDIARRLDLSAMTVSRALSGHGSVSPKTKARILAAARKLRYRPNMLMYGVRTGRTRTIGVIMPTLPTFFSHLLEGLHDELAEADFTMMLSWSKGHLVGGHDKDEGRFIHRLLEHRVDGIILQPTHDNAPHSYFQEIWNERIPLVAVDRRLPNVKGDFVGTDDRAAGRMAADYLLSLGHRLLGHLAGPSGVTTAMLRRQGFEEMAANHASVLVAKAPQAGIQASSFLKPALDMLSQSPRPTAIFAWNDDAAYGAFQAAIKLGLSIPRDLSIIGVGDLEVSLHTTPRLSTIQQHPNRIGRTAARMILNRLGGKANLPPQSVEVPPDLVIRESTGPAPTLASSPPIASVTGSDISPAKIAGAGNSG